MIVHPTLRNKVSRDRPKKYKRRQDAYHIKVKLEQAERCFRVDVYNDMTVTQLKEELEFSTGIPVNIQILSYLDEGELLDDTTVRSNDFVPCSTARLKVWPMYRDLVEAVIANETDLVLQLGVTDPTDYHTPASDYMTKKSRKAWIKERAFIALCLASHVGHEEMVINLIQSGAEVNRQMPSGKTPLHLASARGHGGLVNTLLHHGADINAEDHHGNTALSVAERFGSKVCSRHLFQFQWQERAKTNKPSKQIYSTAEPVVALPAIHKRKLTLKQPVTYDEWMGKQKVMEKKAAMQKKFKNEEDRKRQLEEEERKKEENEKLAYENWLTQREQEKLDYSARHSSLRHAPPSNYRPTRNISSVSDNQHILPVHHDGALRQYLRNLGTSKTGINYEDWLNDKEMEINQLVQQVTLSAHV